MQDILMQLAEILESLRSIAPEVYAAAHTQVYISGFWNTLTGSLSLLLAFGMYKTMNYVNKYHEGQDDSKWQIKENKTMTYFIAGTSIVLVAVFAYFCLSIGISRVINPDWYTIQLLLDLVN